MSVPVPPTPPESEQSGGIIVNDRLTIPRAELTHRASRAGGAGGQHVNTSSTRIELLWNVATSPSLPDEVRARLLEKLSSRVDGEGNVRVVASNHRSQGQNRAEAEKRLAELIRKALVVQKARRATKPTRASKEKRLDEKKRRSETKKRRRELE